MKTEMSHEGVSLVCSVTVFAWQSKDRGRRNFGDAGTYRSNHKFLRKVEGIDLMRMLKLAIECRKIRTFEGGESWRLE